MEPKQQMERMNGIPRSEAIRRAAGQIPTPPLADDFTARTMARLHCAERRRQRLGRLLMVAYGFLGVAALGAVSGWGYMQMTGQSPIGQLAAWWRTPKGDWSLPEFEIPKFDLPMPQVELPAPTPEAAAQWELVVFLALAGLVLLVADLLIRRRMASQRK